MEWMHVINYVWIEFKYKHLEQSLETPFLTEDGAEADGHNVAEASPVTHQLRGEVLRVVFVSSDGRYSVLRLLAAPGVEHTVVGTLPGVLEGQDIEVIGHWEVHKEHGRQFRVENFRALLPTSTDGISRYLSSGVLPGIGPKLAEEIVAVFAEETLDILDNYSERLKEVPGIGRKRLKEIRSAWQQQSQQRDLQVFLQGLGLTPTYCVRIINEYGAAAAEIVKKNPYRLAAEVHGIGFAIADRIAQKLGVEKCSILRLTAGVVYVLEQLTDQGHSCYPYTKLLAETARILAVDSENAQAGLKQAIVDGTVVADNLDSPHDDPMVYLRWLYRAETELAESLAKLTKQTNGTTMTESLVDQRCELLNEDQRQAVLQAFDQVVSIITGGPGVGKTTVIGYIVRLARIAGLRVLLAAPTGRAAKRMSESTGLEARTIHRLLKWDPIERKFVYNETRPLKCDMLIVDEISMLDTLLANHLFKAVALQTHVVLVGDRDQLPSVGPGTVLHDLIACRRIAVTNLTEIYRQEENSRIVLNAHAVNAGQMPDLHSVPPRVRADFYWIEQQDPERVVDLIATMVVERIPKRFGFNPQTDIQILAPMHRGSCGAILLNESLQKCLHPNPGPQFKFGDRRFRVGDRVMQTANNYDKGVFNGELGQIVNIDNENKNFQVMFDVGLIDYDQHEADQIQLAYAVTVHKSQGSEFPVVIIPVMTQHYIMLQRNLIYTGMTRARRLLIMIGTKKALAIAVRNNKPLLRYSRLAARLSCP